jgi:transposase-like protein
MSSLLSAKHLQDEDAAYAWVERHVWPNGPTCPKCGEKKRVSKMKGKSTRKGTYKCYACRKPFTVKVGTIFEKSHVPMHLWLQAFYLICGSKKGISSNQLHRTLGVTLKTAWFMSHRIREAMRVGSLLTPMGGAGKTVELDETTQGRLAESPKYLPARKHGGWAFRNIVFTLVERGGEARSFKVKGTTIAELIPIIKANVDKESAVMTDAASWYKHMNKDGYFLSHDRVDHSGGEYVRYEPKKTIHSNTVEGYFSIFKRGMKGVYQHCSEKHLHRYLAEYDFRYSNRVALGIDDEQRAVKAIKGVVGKRLTYRTPDREVTNSSP